MVQKTIKKTFSLSLAAVEGLKEKQQNPFYNASGAVSEFFTDETQYTMKQFEKQLIVIDADIGILEDKRAYTISLMSRLMEKEKKQQDLALKAIKDNEYAIKEYAKTINKTVEQVEEMIKEVKDGC